MLLFFCFALCSLVCFFSSLFHWVAVWTLDPMHILRLVYGNDHDSDSCNSKGERGFLMLWLWNRSIVLYNVFCLFCNSLLCCICQSVNEAAIIMGNDSQSIYQDDVHRSLSVSVCISFILTWIMYLDILRKIFTWLALNAHFCQFLKDLTTMVCRQCR